VLSIFVASHPTRPPLALIAALTKEKQPSSLSETRPPAPVACGFAEHRQKGGRCPAARAMSKFLRSHGGRDV
jgi:hypothetical protein